VVAAVDALPVVEGDQREESRDVSKRGVQPLRPEKRLVPALVEQREPLDHRDGQEELSSEPRDPVRVCREVERDPRERDRLRGDDSALAIGGTKMNELGRRRCGTLLHDPVSVK
jgi:hypothetical protein